MAEQNKDNYIVLLAGGSGSRFWPRARVLEPKQFLTLHKNKSLFEETILRIKPIIKPENIFIATSDLYQNQVMEIIKNYKIPINNLILEPNSKNTAPPIIWAAMLIDKINPKAKIAFLPCDHLINNALIFQKLLKKALTICKNKIILLGITPDHPATGYGYIRTADNSNSFISKVAHFYEKPSFKTARRFLKNKGYFWNSGIFISSAKIILKEFSRYLPETYKELKKISSPREINKYWKNIKPISFDYGIIEKTTSLAMIKTPKNLGWSDLGSWQAWDKLIKKDKDCNKFFGQTIDLNSKNITVFGNNKRIIATIGLEGLIVVDTPDALLITKKDKSEEVKKIVEILKSRHKQEHYLHKTVKRGWGCYTVLDASKGFKIKIIEIKPKHAISLQYHNKRSEHWVVVEGQARITKGKKVYTVSCNESTYIPISCIHRISNPHDSTLKIVEVQTGNYLEEADIVRLSG